MASLVSEDEKVTSDSRKATHESKKRKILSSIDVDKLDLTSGIYSASRIYTSRVNMFEKMTSRIHCNELLQKCGGSDTVENAATGPDLEVIQLDEKQQEKAQHSECDPDKLKEDEAQATKRDNSDSDHSWSPSPPSSPACTAKKQFKISRKTTSILKSLRSLECQYKADNLRVPNPLPLNETNLNSNEDDIVFVAEETASKEISLKIRWKNQVYRIPAQMDHKLYAIYPELSKICGCNPSEILLTYHESTVNPESTLAALKIAKFEILDCYVLNPAKEGEESAAFRKEQMIQLKIQAKDSKERITIEVNKMDPMSVLMAKYSSIRSIPLKKMNFYFDGEPISPTDTPIDLDLEDDCCIDVTVKK